MTPDLDRIKTDALAATQAPWSDIDGGGFISDRPAHVVVQREAGSPWFICDMQDDLEVEGVGGCPVANARHIANMDHETTLALIAEVRGLREALVHIQEYWNGSRTDGAMSDALDEILETARKALGDTNA